MNKNKIFRIFIMGAILVAIGILAIWIEKVLFVGIFCFAGLFLMIFSLNEIPKENIIRRLLKSFIILLKCISVIIAFIYANELFFDPQLTVEPYYYRESTKDQSGHIGVELEVKVRKKNPFPARNIIPEIYIEYGNERHFLANWYMKEKIFPIDMRSGEFEKNIIITFTPRPDELPPKDTHFTVIVTTNYKTCLKIRDLNTFRKYKFIPMASEGQKEFTRIK